MTCISFALITQYLDVALTSNASAERPGHVGNLFLFRVSDASVTLTLVKVDDVTATRGQQNNLIFKKIILLYYILFLTDRLK